MTKIVELIVRIGNQSQSITLNTGTPGLEVQLQQFLSKSLASQITLENSEEPKEQLLNEVIPARDFNVPGPAPLYNKVSTSMSDPFGGTSWGINK